MAVGVLALTLAAPALACDFARMPDAGVTVDQVSTLFGCPGRRVDDDQVAHFERATGQKVERLPTGHALYLWRLAMPGRLVAAEFKDGRLLTTMQAEARP